MSKKQYYTAIIFFHFSKEIEPRKYRNINNLKRFEDFARKSEGLYVNYYEKESKDFAFRVWL